tara:strand:+ start:1340 stop:1513 length:174 start_codon:yes stop_codon:yes gene_type:complete
MAKREVTRDQFLEIRPTRKHDEEIHLADRAVCIWEQDGKTLEEHQHDIGGCQWFVSE